MTMQPTPSPRRSLVWKRPGPVGQFEILRGLGGIVAPVLSGFSLAAVVTLLTAEKKPLLAEPSITAFAWCTVCLLLSMQFSSLALRHATVPTDRLAWHPEAKFDDQARERERIAQARDHALALYYEKLTQNLYNSGLLLFVVSLGLLLVPRDWSVWRALALGSVAIGALIEINWIVARGPIYRLIVREEVPFRMPSNLDQISKDALRDS